MDEENQRLVELLRGSSATEVRLFMDYDPGRPEPEVPNPYYGGPEGFELVMDLVEDASERLPEDIRRHWRENCG
jgi:protein-tyrosine phosphatase